MARSRRTRNLTREKEDNSGFFLDDIDRIRSLPPFRRRRPQSETGIHHSHLAPPLRHLEALLISKLVVQEDSTITHFSVSSPAALDHSELASGRGISPTGSFSDYNILTNATNNTSNQELSVRLCPGWKGVLANARVSPPTIYQPTNQQQLQRTNFFLDDIDRVTSIRFLPSDDDVLKARLKTVGVSEYKFEIELGGGRDSGTEWNGESSMLVEVEVKDHHGCMMTSTSSSSLDPSGPLTKS